MQLLLNHWSFLKIDLLWNTYDEKRKNNSCLYVHWTSLHMFLDNFEAFALDDFEDLWNFMKMEERHGRKQRAVDSCTRFCWVPSWNSTLIIDIHSFIKKYKSSQNFVNVTLDLVPHPVTVTTRTVTFLARDPYQHPHPNVTRKKAKKKNMLGVPEFSAINGQE